MEHLRSVAVACGGDLRSKMEMSNRADLGFCAQRASGPYNGKETDSLFKVEYSTGDATWLPY